MKGVKILFFTIMLCSSANAQSFFKGSAVLGFNLSQIDGDDLAGYDKMGLSTGLKVEFPLNAVLDLGIEFLFNQSGSRTSIYNNLLDQVYRIQLNYVSLPLILKWSDWWIEKDAYYKFNVHGGIANSYLINYNIEQSPISIEGELNNYAISYVLGTGFAFTKNWVLTLRYNRNINAIYSLPAIPGRQKERLLGYFLTLRSEYNF